MTREREFRIQISKRSQRVLHAARVTRDESSSAPRKFSTLPIYVPYLEKTLTTHDDDDDYEGRVTPVSIVY
jgi:hypothetical protein